MDDWHRQSFPNLNSQLLDNTFYGNVRDAGSNNISIGTVHGNVRFGQNSDSSALIEIVHWLSSSDFSQYHEQVLAKYTPGTFLAFLASRDFRNWESSEAGGIIWCPGHPGAGKSTFASFVVDYLQRHGATVAYIYCRYPTKLPLLELFKIVLKQLILQHPHSDVLTHLAKIKEQHQSLSLQEVISMLQAVFDSCPRRPFVVIDALDEGLDDATRHTFLRIWRSLSSVNVLLTSRLLPAIERDMHGIPILHIYASPEDITTIIRVRKQQYITLGALLPKVADAEARVIEKADGRFLLADLHIKNLAEQTNPKALMRALDTLPTQVMATHAQAFDRINGQNESLRRLAYRTISLVFYASRPLKLVELQHAVANARLPEDIIADEDDLDDMDVILSSCAGLLTVNKSLLTVGFLHYTVREFVEGIRDRPEFLTQICIAKSLMKIVASPGFRADRPNHPLTDYVARAWHHLVARHDHDKSIRDLVVSHLESSRAVTTIAAIYSSGGTNSRLHETSAGHLIAIFGLERTGRAFFQKHPNCLDEKDDLGRTPLSWAAETGQARIVRLLLDLGNPSLSKTLTSLLSSGLSRLHSRTPALDVDSKDVLQRTSLWYAASKGDSQIVRMLLDTGKVDADARDVGGRTPLLCACTIGNVDVVGMLLATRTVDVNVMDKYNWTPLIYAIDSGRSKVVKLLLDTGNVNLGAKEDFHRMLSWTVQLGHSEIVKLLENYGGRYTRFGF